MSKFFYNVTISIPLRQAFTYHSTQSIIPGTRVAVKFGSKIKLGIVIEEIEATNIQTKLIHQVLDDEPIFSGIELKILAWASDYYHHPIGEVLGSFLPTNLRNIKTVIDSTEIFLNHKKPNDSFLKNLTREQTEAVDILSKLKGFKPTLLYGVTGSGKTEVYIRCIHEQLLHGRSVLLLAPEIALTPQLEQRVSEQFGSSVGMYHSKMTPAKRYKVWQKFRSGEINILIGTRSAAMMSAPNIGLIIVDEEHESSFKQYDPSPRYNGRDAAIVLGRMHEAKVILGTATPSLETYTNAKQGKYGLVSLKERYKGLRMPEVLYADLKRARKLKNMNSHFSNFLLEEMDHVLKKGEDLVGYYEQEYHPNSNEVELINMGVKCAVTKNTEPSPYYLYARSSVSKRGIILANSVGIIDSGYRGFLMAAFYNTKKEPVTIESGDRIVQICMPDLSYDFNVQLVESLDHTERGEGGLGSTGK